MFTDIFTGPYRILMYSVQPIYVVLRFFSFRFVFRALFDIILTLA